MKTAGLRVSEAAAGDILEQADWYENQASRRLAERWEKAVTSALRRIKRNPKNWRDLQIPSDGIARDSARINPGIS